MGLREDVLLGQDLAKGTIRSCQCKKSSKAPYARLFLDALGTQEVLEKRNHRVKLCVPPLGEKAQGLAEKGWPPMDQRQQRQAQVSLAGTQQTA